MNKIVSKMYTEIGISTSDMSATFVGVKVLMEENISSKTVMLLREYIKRYFGPDSVSFSPVALRSPIDSKFKYNPVKLMKEWGDIIIFSITLALWICFLWAIAKPIKRLSYLIEKYQRRKFVYLKISISGIVFNHFILLFLCLLSGSFSFQGILIENLIFCLGTLTFMLGKYEFIENSI
jgi:hypothetical protein